MFDESGGYPADNSAYAAGSPTTAQASSADASAAPEASSPSASSDSDVSRNTIVILVVLTLIISILGTWTVLNESGTLRVATKAPSAQTAQVKLNILTEEQYLKAHQPEQGQATGNVALNILK